MSLDVADRDLNNLKPEMKNRVEIFLAKCASNGYNVFITEGFRTKERQLHLWTFGRNLPSGTETQYLGYDNPEINSHPEKDIVTQTLQSNHLSGEAVDIAFEGAVRYPEDMSIWNAVYDVAESCGLKSLYRRVKWDKPHLEFDGGWQESPQQQKSETRASSGQETKITSEHWAKPYEDKLIRRGIIESQKNLDEPPTRGELYKIIGEILPSQ